jgi:hypothetical protein
MLENRVDKRHNKTLKAEKWETIHLSVFNHTYIKSSNTITAIICIATLVSIFTARTIFMSITPNGADAWAQTVRIIRSSLSPLCLATEIEHNKIRCHVQGL